MTCLFLQQQQQIHTITTKRKIHVSSIILSSNIITFLSSIYIIHKKYHVVHVTYMLEQKKVSMISAQYIINICFNEYHD